MTPEDFRAWLQRRGWSTSQAAEALGIKAQQIQRYLAGTTPVPQYCTYTVTCIGCRYNAHRETTPDARGCRLE